MTARVRLSTSASLTPQQRRQLPAPVQRIRRTAASICAVWVPAEGRVEPIELSLALVTDPEIQALNADWRGKDKPTDVLSFQQYEGEIPPWAPTIGDVVISIDTAQKQALAAGHSLSDELVVLLTHGLLHLLGFDHIEDEDRGRMAEAEEAILRPRGLRSGLVGRAAAD